MQIAEGFSELLGRYDLFLLDQFGVLHNGYAPYPSAVHLLQQMRSAQKRVVIISNSGKSANVNASRMRKLGFADDLYDDIVTSGEVARHRLAMPGGATAHLALGQDHNLDSVESGNHGARCLLVTSNNDTSALADSKLELVHSALDADIVLIAGAEPERFNLSYYEHWLAPAAQRAIPCLCINPDIISLARTGVTFGPGKIAQIYAGLGGPVTWIGKPHAEIYRHALGRYAQVDSDRVLCVGDSIEHDIVGATRSGLHSALVTQGILHGSSHTELARLMRNHAATPEWLLEYFAY